MWLPNNQWDWTRAVAEQPDSGSAEFAHYRSPASPAYLDERVSDLPPNPGQVSSYTIREACSAELYKQSSIQGSPQKEPSAEKPRARVPLNGKAF